ncbi:transferrin receptor-like protein [Cokeromyces recurvatus]|uniref:transferrin receptor-like protein n=1 Tax=Cokeromyces recurvatus TaxID=90255 RepID=UPI0022202B9E|nr:transferrin receptor-like protein [Cokeromyces recurvatus]KAI7906586.1 transferrin receptor-like protein [Cokeromyces recurvatus]
MVRLGLLASCSTKEWDIDRTSFFSSFRDFFWKAKMKSLRLISTEKPSSIVYPLSYDSKGARNKKPIFQTISHKPKGPAEGEVIMINHIKNKITTIWNVVARIDGCGEGIKGREWFKHVVYAPGLWTGYSSQVFPAIVEAIDAKDKDQIKYTEERAVLAIQQATKSLQQ